MNKYQRQRSKEIKLYAKRIDEDYKMVKILLLCDFHQDVICDSCNTGDCTKIKNKRLYCENLSK